MGLRGPTGLPYLSRDRSRLHLAFAVATLSVAVTRAAVFSHLLLQSPLALPVALACQLLQSILVTSLARNRHLSCNQMILFPRVMR
ncbi:hypothetical protein K443DRAFT_482442 [Laccaria amethystina LaAM-08-1]|uniref:Uncharacterized protein n=1 Tax=Laccaria amethystina LaAM-08-1 TaxID=1095629 RepID=A0A0C9WN04_9AGAR|nr:hypothetical protein K443DRAFT_482442 [Laccaria amethystina LaAM-08-1]